ncbi:hypothetical protein QU926_20705 [Pseudomonas asiatica]|uniref:hypothetical protein n=1 Tax=Pseudomonas asiatica TaxID=2219225 RepID=UPI0025AB3B21|nr:hypothetical protein [Pseudomonas asiatica]MDM9556037.1 hypothetical protein [Pseudomonas asiatica]
MDTNKLLPCPFCGAACESDTTAGRNFIVAAHTYPCPLYGDYLNLQPDRWNMRSTTAEIEDLKREQKNDAIAYKAAIERQEELRAERDQLSKELESHKRMLLASACDIGAIGKALGADMDDDGSAIEGLVQELSKDAERLDFLESLARSSYTGASIVKGEPKKSLEVMWFHKRAGAMPSLRKAIDAAMEHDL